MRDAITFAATEADPDAVTSKQALAEPDADQFPLAMEKEVNDHVTRKHWKSVTNEEMKRAGHTAKPIMAVWSMKCKRNPLGEIVKFKARLCAHGGQTIQGVHCTTTCEASLGTKQCPEEIAKAMETLNQNHENQNPDQEPIVPTMMTPTTCLLYTSPSPRDS